MKNLTKYIAVLALFIFSACEEVIDLNIPSKEPRLVVEANFDYDSSESFQQNFEVKLTQSAPFYDAKIQPASNASVYLEHPSAGTIPFEEIGQSGIYTSIIDIPVITIGESPILHIDYKNEKYEARETFIANNSLPSIDQKISTFFGNQYYDITLNFQDKEYTDTPETAYNYYLIERKRNEEKLELSIQNNELTKGGLLKSTYLDEDSKVGDSLYFNHYRIPKNYYQYLKMILESINNGGGPFQIPVGKIKGNILNTTNPEKPALGYFRITQKHTLHHTIYDQNID